LLDLVSFSLCRSTVLAVRKIKPRTKSELFFSVLIR
jgi:hypothetical protein